MWWGLLSSVFNKFSFTMSIHISWLNIYCLHCVHTVKKVVKTKKKQVCPNAWLLVYMENCMETCLHVSMQTLFYIGREVLYHNCIIIVFFFFKYCLEKKHHTCDFFLYSFIPHISLCLPPRPLFLLSWLKSINTELYWLHPSKISMSIISFVWLFCPSFTLYPSVSIHPSKLTILASIIIYAYTKLLLPSIHLQCFVNLSFNYYPFVCTIHLDISPSIPSLLHPFTIHPSTCIPWPSPLPLPAPHVHSLSCSFLLP